MVKLLDILFRNLLGSNTTWYQAEQKILSDLGIKKTDFLNWKPHEIIRIDSEKCIVILRSEGGKEVQIESDKKTIRNLIEGISKNKFLPKYGTTFMNEIRGWTYAISRTKPAEYKVDLRAKLKPQDQTSEKRKKMYHKRNVIVTEFFIKNLVEKTK